MTHDDTPTSTATPSERPTAPRPSAGHVALVDALDASSVASAVIGLDGSVIDANQTAQLWFTDIGADASRSNGHPTVAVQHILQQVPRRLFEDVAGGSWTGDIDTDAGTGQPVEATVQVRHDPTSPSGGTVAVLCRPTPVERRRADELEQRLAHDPLTDLPNRAATMRQAAQILSHAAATDPSVAVLLIDIDRLRDVNDALGYELGDRLIASTAKRLRMAVRPTDFVGRTGSDEFAVVCPGVGDIEAAIDIAERLRTALTGRMTIRSLELDVSVTIGVSLAGPDIDASVAGAAELIAQADTAAHAAKRHGRGAYGTYSPDLRDRALERTELAAALTKAVRGGEMRVEFQPIFSSVSERAEAAEALVRWAHPTHGRIEAGEFIAMAEQTGVIVELGDWVLDAALAATRRWIEHEVVGQKFSVHVNVSRLQLADAGFVDRVVTLLREYQLRPPQLVLEAREATLLGDTGEVMRAVQALRRVGVRIALDNFGTGSNALSLLTDVGADVLKLDGSLALPTGSSEADTRVVRALVLLAHALHMEVVAERVSGVEQLRRLREAGCDMVQGHFVGMPAAADDLVTRMQL